MIQEAKWRIYAMGRISPFILKRLIEGKDYVERARPGTALDLVRIHVKRSLP